MLFVNKAQRWRSRRVSYRPVGEPICTAHYEVAAIDSDTDPKDFVVRHHYSGTYPAARVRFGLYTRQSLTGVAVFSVPMQPKVLDILPCSRDVAVELGRFVLLDAVPANGESWFLARCFEMLKKEGYEGVVSFADPLPRQDSYGKLVSPGHLGTIYQASNGCYTGQATPRTLHLFCNGCNFSDRAASKIRKKERGWRYATEQLLEQGARPPRDAEDPARWLREVLPTITRAVRHLGNHRYVWGLERTCRRTLLSHLESRGMRCLPYPKIRLG